MIPDRRFVLASAAGLVLAPGAFAQPPRIPFEYANGKILVPALVNGQPVQAMLDSGSTEDLLDKGFAARIGLPADGRRFRGRGVQTVIEGREAQVGSIVVGGRTLSNRRVVTIDYAGLAVSAGREVEMGLGSGLFFEAVVDLDFADHSLALHDRAGFVPPSGQAPIPLTDLSGRMSARVGFPDGQKVQALVDTGSEPALILSPGPARRVGIFNGRTSTAPLGGIGGGGVARVASASRLTLENGLGFEDIPVHAAPKSLGQEANLGLAILSRFRLFLDFGGRRMWLAPGGPQAPFRRDLFGVFGVVEGEWIRITHVAADSPAKAAGLRPGEVIVAFNGASAAVANQALRDAPAGTMLIVTLSSGATRPLVLARYY